MKKITLKDYAAPYRFYEFDDTRAWKFRDVEVVREVDGTVEGWPGTHKNVFTWWVLANGYTVGWNENPARGWSFPVVKYPR